MSSVGKLVSQTSNCLQLTLEQTNKLFNLFPAFLREYFFLVLKGLKKKPPPKLFKYRVWLLLKPHVHHFKCGDIQSLIDLPCLVADNCCSGEGMVSYTKSFQLWYFVKNIEHLQLYTHITKKQWPYSSLILHILKSVFKPQTLLWFSIISACLKENLVLRALTAFHQGQSHLSLEENWVLWDTLWFVSLLLELGQLTS